MRAQYLERVLADADLRPEIVPAELRLEAGDPVAGLVVRATKPTGAGDDTMPRVMEIATPLGEDVCCSTACTRARR